MRVVHCKREYFSHYIGRGHQDIGLSNPFSHKVSTVPGVTPVDTLEEALSAFEEYARGDENVMGFIAALPQDAILGCWCKNESVCHGGIIKKLWREIYGVDC